MNARDPIFPALPSATRTELRARLEALARGDRQVDDVLAELAPTRVRTLRPDLARAQRCGHAEVVYGEGKDREELLAAARSIHDAHGQVLVTRLSAEHGEYLASEIPGACYHPRARCLVAHREPPALRGRIAVLCAGTSDVPVAEEARLTAEITGSATDPCYDVGVAGVHRLLEIRERIDSARVVVVVAGMDGALPSVVAGLTRRPIIAVPTSVGYGASFGGLAALLTMLNSCATGVAVVNIDNGFGAGMLASRINRLADEPIADDGDGAPG